MDKEELLDFYESNKDYVIKLSFYECENEITLEDLCRLIKVINEKGKIINEKSDLINRIIA